MPRGGGKMAGKKEQIIPPPSEQSTGAQEVVKHLHQAQNLD